MDDNGTYMLFKKTSEDNYDVHYNYKGDYKLKIRENCIFCRVADDPNGYIKQLCN